MPDEKGPHPAILFCCGHVDPAKADSLNQRACIELALNGFVVLIVDPIGQGERTQYRDPETGDVFISGGGGVFEHCYAGQQCFYAGENLARYMIHDARCGLDYLASRRDVDEDRLGVTGTSGGGIQTQYLCLVDDRPVAAAPCCSVTEREEWLKTGKRIDAEQLIHDAIPQGINYDDLLTGMAPDPICIGAASSDEYFPIEGVHETFERVQRVYDLHDARENVDLTIAETTHCSVYELGDEVFEWFCHSLGDGGYVSHDDLSIADKTELQCTPEGSVRTAYSGERTVSDLIHEDICKGGRSEEGLVTNDHDESASALREILVQKFHLDRADSELYPRHIHEKKVSGLEVHHFWFKSEREPDIVVTGVLASDPAVTSHSPALVCYEQGTEELSERSADVAALAAEHGAVLFFDPRGVGAVRNRTIPIPAWVDGYYDIYGTEFKLSYDMLLLGESLFGGRVYDVLRAITLLRTETGCR